MNSKEIETAEQLIKLALAEDIADGDITTDNLIPSESRKKAYMKAKADGVIAGLQVIEMVFRKLDPGLSWKPVVNDGSHVKKGDVIVHFEAGYRAILTGERTALNFLQRLSGIATMADKYVQAIKGTKTVILDTRKTTPGFRLLDKYAVRKGGAANHRTGLFDMVMIKDNHIEVAGGITQAIEQIKVKIPSGIKIEVETSTVDQVREALEAGADIIMLDNMDIAAMTEAVKLINGQAKIEASGNMTLERLKEVADTGVDYISVGALTHSAKALDISLTISNE